MEAHAKITTSTYQKHLEVERKEETILFMNKLHTIWQHKWYWKELAERQMLWWEKSGDFYSKNNNVLRSGRINDLICIHPNSSKFEIVKGPDSATIHWKHDQVNPTQLFPDDVIEFVYNRVLKDKSLKDEIISGFTCLQ